MGMGLKDPRTDSRITSKRYHARSARPGEDDGGTRMDSTGNVLRFTLKAIMRTTFLFLLSLAMLGAQSSFAQTPGVTTFPATSQDIVQRNTVHGLQSEVDRLGDQKNAITASMERTEKSLLDLQKSMEVTTKANNDLQAERQRLETATANARRQLEESDASRKRWTKDESEATRQLTRAKEELAKIQTEVSTMEASHKARKMEAEQEQARLKKATDDAKLAFDAQQAQLATARTQDDEAAKSRKAAYDKETAAQQKALEALKTELAATRSNAMDALSKEQEAARKAFAEEMAGQSRAHEKTVAEHERRLNEARASLDKEKTDFATMQETAKATQLRELKETRAAFEQELVRTRTEADNANKARLADADAAFKKEQSVRDTQKKDMERELQSAQNALKATKYDTEQARSELARSQQERSRPVAPVTAPSAMPVLPQGGSNLARTLEEMQADALAEQIKRSMRD